MKSLGRTRSLGLVLGLLATGCEEERASNDGVIDAGIDAAVVDASTGAGDASSFACTSWTAPTATTCGGSHCQQSPEQLRADTPSTATCGADEEVTAFCSLEAVDVVGSCVKTAGGAPEVTKACAMQMLGTKVGSACLDCFVASAQCVVQNCLGECIVDNKTAVCDECRVRKGCISQFYGCAGFKIPGIPTP